MKTLEKNLEKKFVKLCEARGWIAVKMGQQGWADRLILMPGGAAAFVELKAPRGYFKPRQLDRAKQLIALGFPVYSLKGTVSDCKLTRLTEASAQWRESVSHATKKGKGLI